MQGSNSQRQSQFQPRSQRRPVGRPTAAAFRRRRVAAGIFGLATVFLTAQGADAVVRSSQHGGTQLDAIHYRVRSGDTLWSIAKAVAPHDDPRAVVDLLVQAHGGAVIHPGDAIDWVR